eukprot:IDg15299t1
MKTPVSQISDLVALPDGRLAVCGEGIVNAAIVFLPECTPKDAPMQVDNMPNKNIKSKYSAKSAPLTIVTGAKNMIREGRKSNSINFLMSKWKNIDVRSDLIQELHASDIAAMLGAFILHYDVSLEDRFLEIKERLAHFFLENDIHGDVLVGKHAVSEEELIKGLLLAL